MTSRFLGLLNVAVESIRHPPVVDEDQQVGAATELLGKNVSVLVRKGDRYTGILTKFDILELLTQ